MRKKILVKAPALSRSGYGEQARFALRALRTREDVLDIYIVNIPWGGTGLIVEESEERAWLDQTILKTQVYVQNQGAFDLSLQITIPNEFEKIAPYNVGYTAGIETTKVAPQWIEKSNLMVDKIITISEHSKKVFENSKYDVANRETGEQVQGWGLQVPVDVVNYAVRDAEPEEVNIEFSTKKNFLAISQWGPRKNLENTIVWFAQEFKDDPDVGLVVKTSTACDSLRDKMFTETRIRNLLKNVPDRKCKVYFVHGELTTGQLTWLYQHPTMHAMINLAHGEGYGLPLFEAAYNGLPLLTMAWSGQLDYMCRPNKQGKNFPRIIKVDYDVQPIQKAAVWEGVLQADSMWAYAKEASYKRALRAALDKKKHYKQEALGLQKHILENFTEEKIYAQFVESLGLILETGPTLATLKQELLAIENPKERATAAVEALQGLSLQTEKLELLKDLFKGESCYVLSCGPTLTEHDNNKLTALLGDTLTVSIKQAYDLFSEVTDFHVYNCANYKNYDYSKKRPVIMEASTTPFKLGQCDLKFFIRERNFDNSVAEKKNFGDWTLDTQSLLRPYGPGIMYEGVFYLLQHLGVSEATTIGWDNKLLPDGADQQHFYDKKGSEYDKANFIHSNEVAANDAAVETLSHEEKITLAVVEEWYDWLKTEGCELKIISRLNPASDKIARVEL
jgi:glycosyltransferase involved in cell wall biosynthesis